MILNLHQNQKGTFYNTYLMELSNLSTKPAYCSLDPKKTGGKNDFSHN